MDTGTHLVFGLGLAGLAHIDPVVAQDSTIAAAVLFGTVLGQQAPDLDTLFRLRGNALYIRQHRGTSHSLPLLLMWAVIITAGIGLFGRGLPLLHIGFWTLLAVIVHVASDMFNTYGTQAARPFTDKWISWNIIHIFDPFIFIAHVAGIFMWAAGIARPENIFPVLYTIIVLYYCWRTLHHYVLERSLHIKDRDYLTGDRYYLIPTINLNAWNVVKRREDGTYAIGDYKRKQLKWVDNVACDCHPAVEASKSHPDVAAFLYFSSFACAELKKHAWGYEVRWADVRYRHRKQYPFVAALLLDLDLQPIDSYVGWLSESRLHKRLNLNAP